jgi:uncharacterized membrane protein YgcG
MTTAADDTAVEEAFEAYLAGRPVPGDAADSIQAVAAFSEAVRASATQPGRPNAALAELLATGLLTDQSSPSTRTARSAGAPPSRGVSRIRNRRRFAMIFPVLLAKFLSAGAVAQAATGAGIVLVTVTGAGAAGALPDPLQNTVATAVETVTPFEFPGDEEAVPEDGSVVDEPLTDEEPAVDEPAVEEPALEDGWDAAIGFDRDEWALHGPADGQSFGSWVSEAARHGGADGHVVRDWAHRKGVHLEDRDLEDWGLEDWGLEGVDVDDRTGTTPAPEIGAKTPAAEPEAATTERHGNRDSSKVEAGSGHGSGHGDGSGHSGYGGGGYGGGQGDGRN